jgi:hypothetical protein
LRRGSTASEHALVQRSARALIPAPADDETTTPAHRGVPGLDLRD